MAMALLDEAPGALLADHEVRLAPDDWQFLAFGDPTGYLSWHVTPDRQPGMSDLRNTVPAWMM
jgi:hypothetical protein